VIAQWDAYEYMKATPDGAFGSVISDPPEGYKLVEEFLRISSGPVVITAPAVWLGEQYPRSFEPRIRADVILPALLVREDAPLVPGWINVHVWRPGAVTDWYEVGVKTRGPHEITMADVEEHPGRKPMSLVRAIVELFGMQTILDPFCGSGTVCMAAMERGIGFVGLDIDPAFVELATKNVEEAVHAVS